MLARTCPATLALAGIAVLSSPLRAQPARHFTLPPGAIEKIRTHADSSGTAAKVVGPTGHAVPATLDRNAVLQVGQYVELPAAAETTQVDSGTRLVLPYRFLGQNAAGEDLELAPVVEIDRGGLHMLPSGEVFKGTVRVGVEDLNHRGQNVRLPPETRFEFFSDASLVDPPWIEVANAGIPYSPVTLELVGPKDRVEFRLRMSFRQDPIETEVPVVRPQIEISMPTKIPGLGVGSANIVVSIPVEAGSKRRQVALEAQRGELESLLVDAAPNQASSIRLRSEGLGPAQIVAKSDPLLPGSTTVLFAFPTAFLLAALFGGTLGAVIPVLVRKRKNVVRYIVAGTLMGLLAAALFVLGVNITSVALRSQGNELAVFVIAAFGGMAVLPLLAKYSPSVSRALSGPTPGT